MSISQLVPLKEAEIALLEELQREGKAIETGELVRRAIKHFPQLTPSKLQKRTPSGSLWWPGRFRFDLDRLRKKGEVRSPAKGCWEVTNVGIQRLSSPVKPLEREVVKLSRAQRHLLDCLVETVEAVKAGEIPATVYSKDGEYTVKLGRHIKETKIVVGKP